MLILEPATARQFGARSLLVFWRDGVGPGRREGVAAQALSCNNPKCPCEELSISGMAIDERARQVSRTGLTLEVLAPADTSGPRSRRLEATIDLGSGVVTALRPSCDPELLEWLAAEVDEELLEHLHRGWMRGRGIPVGEPLPDADLSDYEPGQMVGFEEVFADERVDRFPLDGAMYAADTHLCPDPACACAEALITFYRTVPAPEASIGSVLARLPRGDGAPEPTRFEAESSEWDSLLRDLWTLFCSRHPSGAYLGRRTRRLRAVAPLLLPAGRPRVATREPGRNEPCPCGSGQKFKRCCLGKRAP